MNFWTVNEMLAESFLLNCQIFIVTLLLALPLGLLLSFGTMSRIRPVSALSKLYVYLMRSTPLMLQLAIVYYLPGFLNPGLFAGAGHHRRGGRLRAALPAETAPDPLRRLGRL